MNKYTLWRRESLLILVGTWIRMIYREVFLHLWVLLQDSTGSICPTIPLAENSQSSWRDLLIAVTCKYYIFLSIFYSN
jgi:hypothetical protein